MKRVRLGVVGVGGMGRSHAQCVKEMDDVELVGVCDKSDIVEDVAKKYDCKAYKDYHEMLDPNIVDGVIIATPHYSHTPIAIYAFEKGVHVLCEKPVGVHINDVKKMIEAHKNASKDLKFAAMFQMRVHPVWKKVKEFIDNKEIGKIYRVVFESTSWFRTQAYYDSGDWRGTWAGEGGGVLINQCPHQLDLIQWFFGIPQRLIAVCNFGKYHEIEVEDDVTAIMEYKEGFTLTFTASTGEYPGSYRFQISGDRGKLLVEDNKIKFIRTTTSVEKFIKESPYTWGTPETWEINIPVGKEDPAHKGIIKSFVDSIKDEGALIAEGSEGLNSVMVANAIIYSGMKREAVDFPLDGDKYEEFLKDLQKKSKPKKIKREIKRQDISASFIK